MYYNYLAPIVLLFLSIIIFRILFKKLMGKRVEGFQEEKKNIPAANDEGVKLLYEIRGMMLNNQNDIDKQIQLLSERRDTSIVLDKMSELENLLKGKTTMSIDPSEDSEQPTEQATEELEEPEEDEESTKKQAKKQTKAKKKVAIVPPKKDEQPVDDGSDDEEDIVEGFVEGMEYNSSATNCFEV